MIARSTAPGSYIPRRRRTHGTVAQVRRAGAPESDAADDALALHAAHADARGIRQIKTVPRVGASRAPSRVPGFAMLPCDAVDLQTGAKERIRCSLKSCDPQNILFGQFGSGKFSIQQLTTIQLLVFK